MLCLYKLGKYIKNNHQINSLYCNKYIKRERNIYYFHNNDAISIDIKITNKLDITITNTSRVKFTWHTFNIFNNIVITKHFMKSIFYILDKYNLNVDNVYIHVISGPDQPFDF